ncbi:DMT family transporter [Nisaea sp.]|uniref:DMT family transporter n=1 Tax=Nisaea sp. TaxID=2024842 RepID=UPI003B51F20A
MPWLFLILAGLLEVVWAFAMKQTAGFARLVPVLVMIPAMVGSFALLALAMRKLPLGTAYTIWTGIGAIGAFLVGVIVLGEALTPMRATAALLIVTGMIMMKAAE